MVWPARYCCACYRICLLIITNFQMRAGMEKTEDYYLRAVVAILSSKWTLPVLYGLRDGTRRYHEINKAVPDMTQKVLTDMLHKLERHGFIERVAHPTVPPKVEYSLPYLGGSFVGALVPVVAWTKDHLFFFFKQKTAYEISTYWSSDVCSSDLGELAPAAAEGGRGLGRGTIAVGRARL